MSAIDGNKVAYSTVDGKIALIGDAAHAMTPSMGEGCNTALVSAVKLVDSISSVMGEQGESTCSVDTLSEGFVRYGSTRPTECIPVQEESQARNVFRKAV
jgi:2-polyprenyl-6-methoxyphenol hydroxylase-like FAD-dependent oxidoreductase